MSTDWAEGTPRSTDSATRLRRRERTSQRYRSWRLLFSDDRLPRRRRLPRLASPVSTDEVETSHPPVCGTPPSLTCRPPPIIPVPAPQASSHGLPFTVQLRGRTGPVIFFVASNPNVSVPFAARGPPVKISCAPFGVSDAFQES